VLKRGSKAVTCESVGMTRQIRSIPAWGGYVCLLVLLAACSPQTNATGAVPGAPSAGTSANARTSAPISLEPADVLARTRPATHPLGHGPGWLSPAAKNCKQKLFASSYWLDYIAIYCVDGKRQNQAPIGEITDGIRGPEGAATDSQGNLYVTNTPANTVTEYAAGSTNVSFTYSSGLSSPAAVAVDKKQNVYVTSIGSGSVTIFLQGVNSPHATLTGIPYPIDVAVDAKRNTYVTSYTSSFSNGIILEYPVGSTQGTDLGIVTEVPGGIVLDKSGDIVTADQRLPGVLVFPPGSKTPSNTFARTMFNPISVRFDRSESQIFVGDSVDNAVDVFSYPAGKLVDTITDGIDGPEGVALYPAAPLSPHSW
jgi:sugar lactone lactonase YvrE